MGQDESALFTPQNGGLGAFLSCTGTSARVAFPSPMEGSVFAISNGGTDNAFVAFGGSTVTATTSYMMVQPGITYVGIPNAGGSGAPTWFAGITQGATVIVQITAGNRVAG